VQLPPHKDQEARHLPLKITPRGLAGATPPACGSPPPGRHGKVRLVVRPSRTRRPAGRARRRSGWPPRQPCRAARRRVQRQAWAGGIRTVQLDVSTAVRLGVPSCASGKGSGCSWGAWSARSSPRAAWSSASSIIALACHIAALQTSGSEVGSAGPHRVRRAHWGAHSCQ